MSGRGGVTLQLSPKLRDMGVHRAAQYIGLIPPYPGHQFQPGDDGPAAIHFQPYTATGWKGTCYRFAYVYTSPPAASAAAPTMARVAGAQVR